jgi:indolepyruvate ferredoxin oxidoreductase alpha subunit
VQGGLYNGAGPRAAALGLADAFGASRDPAAGAQRHLPAGAGQVAEFCRGKRAVLVLEEGQPEYIEQDLAPPCASDRCATPLHGKDLLPDAGEYTSR